jgi:transcriptional regulator with XRE-family HTH domain
LLLLYNKNEELTSLNILNRIDELRKEKGWSVYKLSKEAGLKQSTVSNLYERNNAPTFPTLEKLCAAFGISFADFFAESTAQSLTEEQIEFLSKWESLTLEQKKNLLPILMKNI